jgi:hypothetical protein
MRKDDTWHINQKSTWQLLLQFVSADGPASERESVQRVTEAVQELGLPSSQVEQIGKAVTGVLQKATKRGLQDRPEKPVTVRIWVSDGYTGGRTRSSSHGQGGGRQARGGWGFFVVQKQAEEPQASARGAHHLVELFLYQEGEHARKRG